MRITIRLSVAITVILPLFLLFGGGWLTTFAIALAGFGLGRAAEQLLFGPASAQAPGRAAMWMALGAAAIGAVLLAGVQLVEHRLADRRTSIVEQRQQLERAEIAVQSQARASQQVWRVEVSTDGSIQSDGLPTPLESLTAPKGVTRAEIRAQADAPYAQIIAAMDKIRAAGISDITLTR